MFIKTAIKLSLVLTALLTAAANAQEPKWSSGQTGETVTKIYCDGPLTYDTGKGTLRFKKNVIVTRGGMKMEAESVDVFIDVKTRLVKKIMAMSAPGERIDITLTQKNVPPRRALAKFAIYEILDLNKPPADRKETLTLTSPGQRVSIYQGNTRISSTKVVMDMKSSDIEFIGEPRSENVIDEKKPGRKP